LIELFIKELPVNDNYLYNETGELLRQKLPTALIIT